ncbi:MAG: tetratricopeptide repeat protein [Pseudomonadales bacterium]
MIRQVTTVFVTAWVLVLAVHFSPVASAASQTVSGKAYNRLNEAQELMGAKQIDQAVIVLETLLSEVASDSLDRALTLQTLGYAEMSRERFPDAIKHLRASLDTGLLPEKVKYNVGYMVAQLYAAQEQFDEALLFAKDWFATLVDPNPNQMIFMANIFAQTKRYDEAIPYAERAIAATDKPKESWFQLLTAAAFELKDYDVAVSSLKRMVTLWPNQPEYWEQLASVLVVQEREPEALAALKLAWHLEVLQKESSIKSLVQLAITRGVPEHAARLIESAFEQKLLPRDAEYVDLLGNSWVAARESDQAIEAFTELSALEDSGEGLARVASLHLEAGRLDLAEESLERAIEAGLEEPGKAWLLLGIVLAEQQSFTRSFEALRMAAGFDATRKQATRWLSYAEDMRKQQEWQARYGSS